MGVVHAIFVDSHDALKIIYIYICWWHFFCDGILWRGYGWGWYVVDNSKPACIYNILPKNPKSNIQVSKSFKNKSATQALQTGVKNLYKMVPWKHQRLALLATTSLLHLTTTCFLWLCWRVKMCYYKMVMHWNHVSQHALQGSARRFLRTDAPPLCSTFWMRQHCKTTKWLAQPHHGNWKGDAYPTLWKRKNSIFPTISRG